MRIAGDHSPAGRTRPSAGAYAFVAVLIAISAWFENHQAPREASRSPASTTSILSERAKVNPNGSAPGAFSIGIKFEIALNQGLTYEDVVGTFVDTDLTNALPDLLGAFHPGPLGTLRTEVTRRKTESAIYYEIVGWSTKSKWLTKNTSRLTCTETLTGSAGAHNWAQTCSLDGAYKDGLKFNAAYTQRTTCAEKRGAAVCDFSVDAITKAVDLGYLPKFIRKMLGVDSLSANQVAIDSADLLLVQAEATVAAFEYAKPLAKHAGEAVADYGKSGISSLVKELRAKRPSTLDGVISF